MADDLQRFLALWDEEAKKTAELLRALPADQYDLRPDPGGRSIGEIAWHLAEIDAYTSFCIESGEFDFAAKPPGIARPRTVAELAPGYERVHAEAKERLGKLRAADLDRKLRYFDLQERGIREILWTGMLLHQVHHRGQLALLCRLAGGTCPGLFGPNREEMAAFREAARS